VVKKSWQFWKK